MTTTSYAHDMIDFVNNPNAKTMVSYHKKIVSSDDTLLKETSKDKCVNHFIKSFKVRGSYYQWFQVSMLCIDVLLSRLPFHNQNVLNKLINSVICQANNVLKKVCSEDGHHFQNNDNDFLVNNQPTNPINVLLSYTPHMSHVLLHCSSTKSLYLSDFAHCSSTKSLGLPHCSSTKSLGFPHCLSSKPLDLPHCSSSNPLDLTHSSSYKPLELSDCLDFPHCSSTKSLKLPHCSSSKPLELSDCLDFHIVQVLNL